MNSKSLNEWLNSLKTLLTESRGVSARKVSNAIDGHYRVIIRYNDNLHRRKKGQKPTRRKKGPTGPRLIEPYVLGISKTGNSVLRAFQYNGASKKGVPKWKLFRLDRIIGWEPRPDDKFYADPSQLAIVAPNYNQDGDNSMLTVIKQLQFNSPKLEKPSETRPDGEWESPLEKVKRQGQIKVGNIEKQTNSDQQKSGAINTKSLSDSLDSQSRESFGSELNARLGVSNSNRGAVAIGQDKYDRDALSPQQRRDKDVIRKREERWQNAVDSRPLHRKNSPNRDLWDEDPYNAQRDIATKTLEDMLYRNGVDEYEEDDNVY